MNDIVVGAEMYSHRLGDGIVPWSVPSNPDWETPFDVYKKEASQFIQEHVQTGEHVCIIGGGFGVSCVYAAEAVDKQGEVTVFEASQDRYSIVQKTVKLNSLKNVEVKHALVGKAVDVSGELGNPAFVPPKDLQQFDVLELDCEGAEREILSELNEGPRLIIVETHPDKDASTDDIIYILKDAGYTVLNRTPEPGGGDVIVATDSGS